MYAKDQQARGQNLYYVLLHDIELIPLGYKIPHKWQTG